MTKGMYYMSFMSGKHIKPSQWGKDYRMRKEARAAQRHEEAMAAAEAAKPQPKPSSTHLDAPCWYCGKAPSDCRCT